MIAIQRLKLLSLALLLSGATVVLAQQWLHGAVRRAADQARAQAPGQATTTTRVLVAASPLPAGATVKPGSLRWQAWPSDVATSSYLTDANVQIDQMNGAVVRSNLTAGEPIAAGLLLQPRDRSFLAAVLEPGYRAVTINVTAASAVAGFVMPGDRVDLILSRTTETGTSANPNFVSETVLTDLRVLGADQRGGEAMKDEAKKDVAPPQTVTLEVTPKGAEVIAVAGELGKLSLSLRSLANGAPASDRPPVTRTSAGDATQSVAPRRLSRPAAAPRTAAVEVVRGG